MTKAEVIAVALPAQNITFTTWPHRTAVDKGTAKSADWNALVAALCAPGESESKSECKMIKLATFSHGCKADDMERVYGIEGDYDGETVSIDDAAARLIAAGVKAFLYTSGSHGVHKPPKSHGGPRWRVLAPLSRAHTPAERAVAVALLNGALGGILAAESWTPAQRFFYGKVRGVAYETRTTTGDCIDTLDLLITSIGKPLAVVVPGKTDYRAPGPVDDLERGSALAGVTAETITELRSALAGMKAKRAEDRVMWVNVLQALASLKETSFADDAFEMAQTFSERCPAKFNLDDLSTKWEGMAPTQITHKSIFKWAMEDGWKNPGTAVRDLGQGTFDAPALLKCDARDGTHDTRQLTETGNALRMLDAHGERLRYVPDAQAWLAWGDCAWQWDAGAAGVRSLAANLHTLIYAEGAQHVADIEHFVKWARASQKLQTIKSSVALLSDYSQIRLPLANIDADHFAVGFDQARQVIDLRNGATRAATPADYITKTLRVEAIGGAAKAVRWAQFLDQVFGGDAELIDWMQRFAGYLLTGSTREQIFLFCFGYGANGKSVFIEVLKHVMGDYSRAIASETLSESKRQAGSATPDLAALIGARLVLCSETEDNTALAESLVKSLVGGDSMSVRNLYAAPVQFTPNFKLVMAGNHKPIVRGNDNGLWRRVRLVPFNRSFTPEERDLHLIDKLKAEAPHILAWMVAGCIKWQQHGLADTPAAVRAATEEYRTDQDITGAWFEERIVAASQHDSPAASLYASYSAWCTSNGHRPASSTALGRRLEERGYRKGKSRGVRVWFGLAVREHDDTFEAITEAET